MHDRSTHLTLLEAWDETQVFLTGPVLAAGVVPGLLFCAPGLIFFGAAIVIPLILVAILLALVAILVLLVAAPVLIVRAIVSRARSRRASVQLPRPQPERRLIARSPR
jgi:hypothetical protein